MCTCAHVFGERTVFCKDPVSHLKATSPIYKHTTSEYCLFTLKKKKKKKMQIVKKKVLSVVLALIFYF